jgi:hypothetical protein
MAPNPCPVLLYSSCPWLRVTLLSGVLCTRLLDEAVTYMRFTKPSWGFRERPWLPKRPQTWPRPPRCLQLRRRPPRALNIRPCLSSAIMRLLPRLRPPKSKVAPSKQPNTMMTINSFNCHFNSLNWTKFGLVFLCFSALSSPGLYCHTNISLSS